MVMKLNKSIPRVMKEKLGVYVGMMVLTFLAVLMFVLLTLVAQNLYIAKNTYVRDNVWEYLEFISTAKIENIAEIEESFTLKMEGVPITEYTFQDKTLRLFAAGKKVNIPAVIEGNLPKTGEITLDPSFAKANGYEIGDMLEINDRSYTVSGIVTLPHYSL